MATDGDTDGIAELVRVERCPSCESDAVDALEVRDNDGNVLSDRERYCRSCFRVWFKDDDSQGDQQDEGVKQ
jgi:hypothetical protein